MGRPFMPVSSGPHQRIWRRAFRAQDTGWSRFEDIHLGGGLSNQRINPLRAAGTVDVEVIEPSANHES